MRFFLAIMVLFASLTYTFSVQAADCGLPHDCSVSQNAGDIGNDCYDPSSTDSDTTDMNCPDCCLQHHVAFGVLALGLSTLTPQSANKLAASGDTYLHSHAPSGLLKPPRNV